MEGLGKKLQRLRKRRGLTGPAVARRALGEEATDTQIKSFANYLSRLERGRETNPSLLLLEQLARGFTEPTVSSFLAQIETSGRDNSYRGSQESPSSSDGTIHVDEHADGARPIPSELGRAIGKALIDAGAAIHGLASGIEVEQPRSALPRARGAKSARRRRGA